MIRIANIEDLKKFIEPAQKFYESTGRNRFNPIAFLNSWTSIIGLEAGFILGQFIDGDVHEAIGVLIYPDPNEGVRCAQPAFWYVDDSNGGTGLANGILFNAFMDEMVNRNVMTVFFEVIHNDKMHKVTNFLQKSGFIPVGTIHRKEL